MDCSLDYEPVSQLYNFFVFCVDIYVCRADNIDIHTGQEKHPDVYRVGFGAAQKMRAAITSKFGRDFGLGSASWMENPLQPEQFVGNPSMSPAVSQYMVSLRRRKVCYLFLILYYT